MIFIEELAGQLRREGKIRKIVRYTPEFSIFMMNLRLSLILPTLVYGPDSDPDYAAIDSSRLSNLALANIITSLESYYEDIFKKLSKLVLISETDSVILNKFLNKFNIRNEYYKGDYVHKVLPDYLSFQKKDVIKVSFNLINLNPIHNSNKEWNDTFNKKEDSTIKIRHKSIHEGIDFSFKIIDVEFVHERIKHAIVLVRNLEEQIDDKYPQVMIDSPLKQK